MRHARWLALAVLLGTMSLVGGQSTTKSAKRRDNRDGPIPQRIARDTKLTEDQVQKVWNAIGPAIRDDLRRGKSVDVPGLGRFRVVRVAAHKDLGAGGRPVVVPAFNTVEFVGSAEVGDAVSGDDVTPAVEVPAFQFIPRPNATPGQKQGRTHAPSQRVP